MIDRRPHLQPNLTQIVSWRGPSSLPLLVGSAAPRTTMAASGRCRWPRRPDYHGGGRSSTGPAPRGSGTFGSETSWRAASVFVELRRAVDAAEAASGGEQEDADEQKKKIDS
ncbi:hypothetical protein PVAP13_9KG384101 [Panicum virgatum]|uniref:Uncharacterized protein n=1 Tax=Panicum virgatum TaxID=38727 RepID=A0A8T0NP12_PANVG|nr:hypothetical protein PVAP13_9KG384101 [Panicum virgatum]